MDSAEFAAAMARRDCVSDGKNYCGLYRGFPFVVTFARGATNGLTAFVLRLQFSAPPGKLFRELKKRLNGVVRLQKLNMANNLFFATVTIAATQPFETTFDRLIAETVNTSAAMGFSIPDACPICKNPGCDAYAFVGVSYRPVHIACVRAQNYDARSKVQKNEMSGNYITGIIGAIIGSVIGAVPTVLLAVYGEIISGWLCALIPLGAYYGYKLLRGKLNKATLAVVIVVSLIMAPVTQFFVELFWSVKEGYGVFAVSDYLSYVFAVPGEVMPNMLLYLLFIAIGFVVVFRIVKTTNTAILQQSSFSEATLRMMRPQQFPAQTQPAQLDPLQQYPAQQYPAQAQPAQTQPAQQNPVQQYPEQAQPVADGPAPREQSSTE